MVKKTKKYLRKKRQMTHKNIHNKLPNVIFDRYGQKFEKVSRHDKSFDNNIYTRESHNCYTYYLNKKSGEAFALCKKDFAKHSMCRRPQPGYASGYPKLTPQDYNCNEIVKRTLADNPHIRVITEQEAKEIGCNMDEYMGAVVVAPKYDYHYYRMNDDGQWTHKPGYKPSTHLDADNNIIVNPKYANRKYSKRLNYKNFCTFTCLPRSSNKKSMSHEYAYRRVGGKNRKSKTTKNKTLKKKETK